MLQKKVITKEFPGEVHRGNDIVKSELNNLFLYNKKIDALVYAYLQDMSHPVEIGEDQNGKKIYQTRVWKEQLPSQEKICKTVRIGSRSTLRTKIANLKQFNFIKQYDEYYLLPKNVEKQFFSIPLETLKFLIDACSSNAIKIYIYLGQGFKMKEKQGRKYYFTKDQLISAIKIPKTDGHQYQIVDNILDCLQNNGLIERQVKYNGKIPRIELTDFNLNYKKTGK